MPSMLSMLIVLYGRIAQLGQNIHIMLTLPGMLLMLIILIRHSLPSMLFMLILLISVGYLIVPESQLMPTMPTELTGQTTQDPLSGQIQRIISIQIPSGRR